ncbi:hypothetical protein WA026_001821 [Henosepilachna vigintioctopunctata]|uniref:Uncharacterized protein n=1 Tax=Henosepilachna vigintioctopunctata TaxID=420089 RepID=A0AAW1UUY1_9CUCU
MSFGQQVIRLMRNTTRKLCTVCVKQYGSNDWNCETKNYGFCITIMHQLTYRSFALDCQKCNTTEDTTNCKYGGKIIVDRDDECPPGKSTCFRMTYVPKFNNQKVYRRVPMRWSQFLPARKKKK